MTYTRSSGACVTGGSFGRSSPRAHAATQSRATTWRCGSRESRLIPVSQLRGSRPHPHLLQRRRPHLAVGHGRSNPPRVHGCRSHPAMLYSPFRHWMQPVDQSPSPAVATPTRLVLLPRRRRAGRRWSTPEASAESSHPLMLQPFKKKLHPLDEKLQPDVEKATSGQRHRRKATTVDMKCYILRLKKLQPKRHKKP